MVKFYSDEGQDKWVLERLDNKRNGYFVDIGAYDGINGSNTYAMECYFNWRGICVEPHKDAFLLLEKNRRCICENICIFNINSVVDFVEIGGKVRNIKKSGIYL